MLWDHLRWGALVGLVGGVAYGSFVVLVGGPLVRHAETFEAGGDVASVSPTVTTVGSGLAGVLWGLLLGVVVFGVLYYVLEPAIPGVGGVKSVLLGAAGFVTLSGAPWLAFPPQPPGVEQAMDAESRLLWYALLVAAGAASCVLSGYLYRWSSGRALPVRALASATPFALLVVPVLAMPDNPVTGRTSETFTVVYRAVVVIGQLGLWSVMAILHARLLRRRADRETLVEPSNAAE